MKLPADIAISLKVLDALKDTIEVVQQLSGTKPLSKLQHKLLQRRLNATKKSLPKISAELKNHTEKRIKHIITLEDMPLEDEEDND